MSAQLKQYYSKLKSSLWYSVAATSIIFIVACAPRPDIENDEPGEYWVPPLAQGQIKEILELRRDITLHHKNFDAWIPKGWSFSVTDGSAMKQGTMLLASPSTNLSQARTYFSVAHKKEPARKSLDDIFAYLQTKKDKGEPRWVQQGQRRWISEEQTSKHAKGDVRLWIQGTQVDGRQFTILARTPTTSADLYSDTLDLMVNVLRITNEEQSP